MRPLLDKELDGDAELVRKSHALAVVELQSTPVVTAVVIKAVLMPDDTYRTLTHGLGRIPVFVACSAPYNIGTADPSVSNGQLVEDRRSPLDRTKHVRIGSFGWGASVIIDVMVF